MRPYLVATGPPEFLAARAILVYSRKDDFTAIDVGFPTCSEDTRSDLPGRCFERSRLVNVGMIKTLHSFAVYDSNRSNLSFD
jgi:hypothetical protein